MGNGKVLRSINVTERFLGHIPKNRNNIRIAASRNTTLAQKKDSIAKRILDTCLAGFGLIISSPLWVMIAIAIMIEDGFPILIRQERIGIFGKLFRNYKFRSMKKSALSEKVNIQAGEHDQRVTGVGAVLRKCAMDELPQLINILLGDMSFVGPRALLPLEAEVHTRTDGGTPDITQIPGYAERITVMPGLTGIAQIWAPRDIIRRHKFKYDLLYIRKRSFWFDVKLILMSFLVTFSSSWEKRDSKLKTFEKQRTGETTQRRIFDYVIAWAPLALFLILIFPLFNLYDRSIYTWDHFKIFGDTIRIFVPETPLYVLTTLWGVVRDLSHVFAYGLVTFLLFRGFTGRGKNIRLNHFIYTAALLFSFCLVDEIIQAVMPSRGFEVNDIILNLLAAAGVLLLLHNRYRIKKTAASSIVFPPRMVSLVRAWLPPVVYVGLLAVLANFIFTNKTTLYIIDQVIAFFNPQVSYSTMCMWAGKTRDYSHIIIYAALVVLVFRAIQKTCNRSFLFCIFVAGLIGLGFGIFDEFAQGFLLERSSSITDWLIDIIGVGAGVAILIIKHHRTAIFKTRGWFMIHPGR